jgi:exopolyphosphatase/pppGpp-phosphohydrolase
MGDLARIGLVEVGSNTIRYIVADFSDEISFKPITIETLKHDLHPSRPTKEAVIEINLKVSGFLEDAGKHECDHILAYGTAACRKVASEFPGLLAQQIRVLSPAEEAKAAWVAGFACTSRQPGTRCTIIDEGSGSTEFVAATWTGKEIADFSYFSIDLGSVALLEFFKNDMKGHNERVTNSIRELIPDLTSSGVASENPGKLFLLGGVATSIGWLATKKTGMQEYRPIEINGAKLTFSELDQLHRGLHSLYRKDPVGARRFVDTRQGGEEHILKVLSSLPFLTLLASFIEQSGQYYVSGYGVRHGMAFLIRHGLLEHDE